MTSVILLYLINGVNDIEKLMIFIMIICVNINSVMLMITFTLYVFLLKNEFEAIKFELKVNYPEEYFIDLDKNNKNIL